jgi:Tfp pilus assembly PilM family ATPase/Tfp pilus assembly protein PilN
MADYLAVEWEHAHVCGVLAQVSPGRVRVTRTFVISRPSATSSNSGALQFDWLRPELAKLGIEGGQVLVALPRDEAIVKRIELPDVADEELPGMVRLQAGAKSSVALDELCLDFIPLPKHSELPGREVLMATIPRQTLEEVVSVCRSAGLEAKVIGLTAAAVAEFVARAEVGADNAAGGASLVVARHGNRVEISVLRRSHLLFSHSARLSESATGQEAQAIVAEVSRALVALRGTAADVKIERAWTLVSAAEHEQLAESLHRRLSCEVKSLDPFASIDRDASVADAVTDRSLFAGPIGMLLARSDPRVPAVDFLSPRRPPAKRDTRKQRLVTIGAGAGALVVLLAAYQWWHISDQQSQIDALKAESARLDENIKKGQPIVNAEKLVTQWQAEGEDWLDELAALTKRMPPTDKVYLKSLAMKPKLGTSESHIALEGFARDRKEALNLNEVFLATGDRMHGMPVVEKAAPKEIEYYKWSFNKDIHLSDESAKKPKGRSPAAAGQTPGATAPPASAPASASSPSAEKSGRASS